MENINKINEMCQSAIQEAECLIGKDGAAKDLKLTNVKFDKQRNKMIFSYRNPNDPAAMYND